MDVYGCVHVCMCVYVSFCMRVMCGRVCICVHVCVWMWACACVWMCGCGWVHVCVMCGCGRVHVCIYLNTLAEKQSCHNCNFKFKFLKKSMTPVGRVYQYEGCTSRKGVPV